MAGQEYQELRTMQAARLKKMRASLFIYYVKQGRGPRHEERAGVRFFRTDDLMAWTPTPRKRGPKKKGAAGAS
jgi:hypothetical protein